jgi:hypothetical protein
MARTELMLVTLVVVFLMFVFLTLTFAATFNLSILNVTFILSMPTFVSVFMLEFLYLFASDMLNEFALCSVPVIGTPAFTSLIGMFMFLSAMVIGMVIGIAMLVLFAALSVIPPCCPLVPQAEAVTGKPTTVVPAISNAVNADTPFFKHLTSLQSIGFVHYLPLFQQFAIDFL